MGIVLEYPRHARASADSGGWRAAKASKVMCLQPRSPAKRTRDAQRCAGIDPRPRQVLTVGNGTPSASATDLVPPRSSSAASTVNDMEPDIIRNLRTCQGFAHCETTFPADNAPIRTMRRDPRDSQFRAIITRLFLGYTNQAEFCREHTISKTAWNEAETGSRNISLPAARALKREHGLSLDWTLDGDLEKLPEKFQREVRRAMAAKEFPPQAA